MQTPRVKVRWRVASPDPFTGQQRQVGEEVEYSAAMAKGLGDMNLAEPVEPAAREAFRAMSLPTIASVGTFEADKVKPGKATKRSSGKPKPRAKAKARPRAKAAGKKRGKA